jgi:hypothetical protein
MTQSSFGVLRSDLSKDPSGWGLTDVLRCVTTVPFMAWNYPAYAVSPLPEE